LPSKPITVLVSHAFCACYKSRLSHRPRIYQLNNIWRRVKIEKLLITHVPLYPPITSSFSDPVHISQSKLFSQHVI